MGEQMTTEEKFWKRQKLEARICGAVEVLSGAGLIIATYFGGEEVKKIAIPLYAFGGATIADGTADIICGRYFSLIERAHQLVYHHFHKKETNKNSGEFS
jgi:hypothetical protein